ncbi:Aste57867_24022 [Aphanomyces stellatus]|uniref:Aste57867_24022 protein n=1 Tax=Aphanomyces stellatus TaxID=120398 RepID=A0A485LPA4_9STRA|nr:hypothetical protein As57867_023949 [Aphanomyces stellatus]VFU00665.1 Aste57867_24022 [Aphanomyces stellatus]
MLSSSCGSAFHTYTARHARVVFEDSAVFRLIHSPMYVKASSWAKTHLLHERIHAARWTRLHGQCLAYAEALRRKGRLHLWHRILKIEGKVTSSVRAWERVDKTLEHLWLARRNIGLGS